MSARFPSRSVPILSQCLRLFQRFSGAKEGVAAVEFALLLPIFAFIYLMSFQLTVGFSVANNADRAASIIADIVTQEPTTNVAKLDDMYALAKAIMTPYSTDDLHIKITGVQVDAGGNPTVKWSWKDDGTAAYPAGSAVTLPVELRQPNSFVAHTEIATVYNYLFFVPSMTSSTAAALDINKEFYFRQRVGNNVACTNCP
ncbi:TadE/TadG family type IV pilus assembly protein [Rhizobium sp. L1K21]|uniref:TadE/TadG family type IV pilus assembly protein n=1 Tax=Rhizobium sp. L1K21 TaxID=2954933 RepID=UPI0020925D4F|nr:TadE/TadG family type IV pilus assembly protein [Rhizobium sp. L1K21]MCO6187273.1 pilus assembly protein [Rhizobium sp. L1K21]